jgi:hypothetical protein
VLNAALAPGAVGTKKLADGAVTGAKTATDTLTGAQIREATLGPVPEAERAAAAELADDAERLGGRRPSAYLTGVEVVSEPSEQSLAGVKEVTASCPAGTFVVAGGAAIDAARAGIAIVASTPAGDSGWTAVAVAGSPQEEPWRLTATVVCAAGGR